MHGQRNLAMSEDELKMLLEDIVHLERVRKLPVCALESERLLQIYLHATRHVKAGASLQEASDAEFMVTTSALFD